MGVEDFNGDGKPDLAVVNSFSNSVSVLLGTGAGTFQAALNYPVGSFPESMAVGDFNGDGKQDLAVANDGGNVSVLLGTGAGSFQAALNYPDFGGGLVAVADFNGDGIQDLAVANGVLLGNGDGSFQGAVNYPAGNGPVSGGGGGFHGRGQTKLPVGHQCCAGG